MTATLGKQLLQSLFGNKEGEPAAKVAKVEETTIPVTKLITLLNYPPALDTILDELPIDSLANLASTNKAMQSYILEIYLPRNDAILDELPMDSLWNLASTNKAMQSYILETYLPRDLEKEWKSFGDVSGEDRYHKLTSMLATLYKQDDPELKTVEINQVFSFLRNGHIDPNDFYITKFGKTFYNQAYNNFVKMLDLRFPTKALFEEYGFNMLFTWHFLNSEEKQRYRSNKLDNKTLRFHITKFHDDVLRNVFTTKGKKHDVLKTYYLDVKDEKPTLSAFIWPLPHWDNYSDYMMNEALEQTRKGIYRLFR